MSGIDRVVVGTRGSALALRQARWVADRLRGGAGAEVALETIRTTGDVDRTASLTDGQVTGLFTRELDEAVLDRRVDVAVHSLKDLPTRIHPDLEIAAVPAREDPSDALVLPGGRSGGLRELPEGARVGTSSLRRQALARAHRPDLEVAPIRGNVDTRLRKVDEGEYDAAVLAAAGLRRMGWRHRIAQILEAREWPPAPGQGALAVVTRRGADPGSLLARTLEDPEARAAVEAERAVLAALEAGCQLPVGALGLPYGERLRLWAIVASPDGGRVARADLTGRCAAARELGERMAEILRERGAADILRDVRPTPAPPSPR